jgi:MFS family permease
MIWGDDVDPALRPVLGVSLVSSMAASAIWSFMAIWAVGELGAQRELPFAFLVGALLAGATGYAGGYLSDRIGRRRVILLGQGIMVGYPVLLLLLSGSKWAGLAAMALAGGIGALGDRPHRRWWPISWLPIGARLPTPPCMWHRTSASSQARRSAGSCS